jgi:hypothetical protein
MVLEDVSLLGPLLPYDDLWPGEKGFVTECCTEESSDAD